MKHNYLGAIATRNTGLNILLGLYNPLDWHRVLFNWRYITEYKPNTLFHDVDLFIKKYGKQSIRPRIDVIEIPPVFIAELSYIVMAKRFEIYNIEPSQREFNILINQCSLAPGCVDREIADFIIQWSF